jgi:hypothetical protein
MDGALLRFPVKLSGTPAEPGPSETFETLDPIRTKDLDALLSTIFSRIDRLTRLLDDDREQVRRLGIESLAVELIAIHEGGRLQAVRDELGDALRHRRSARITPEGMDYVRRSERLAAEAEKALAQLPATPKLAGRDLLVRPGLGVSTDALLWGPIVLFGLVAVGLVVYQIVAGPKEPAPRRGMRGVELDEHP